MFTCRQWCSALSLILCTCSSVFSRLIMFIWISEMSSISVLKRFWIDFLRMSLLIIDTGVVMYCIDWENKVIFEIFKKYPSMTYVCGHSLCSVKFFWRCLTPLSAGVILVCLYIDDVNIQVLRAQIEL